MYMYMNCVVHVHTLCMYSTLHMLHMNSHSIFQGELHRHTYNIWMCIPTVHDCIQCVVTARLCTLTHKHFSPHMHAYTQYETDDHENFVDTNARLSAIYGEN